MNLWSWITAKLLNDTISTNFQAEAEILKGPHDDLESYLKAVDQLKCIINFFSGNKDLKSGIGVVNQANSLLEKAVVKLEEEFQQLLTRYRFAHSMNTPG